MQVHRRYVIQLIWLGHVVVVMGCFACDVGERFCSGCVKQTVLYGASE
jgi:hypothetical protein